MIYLLYNYPTWLVACIFALGTAGVACLGLFLTRKFVKKEILIENHDIAGVMINIISVLYAVVLAFVVIAVWQDYTDTANTVQKEANKLSDLYRFSSALSDSTKNNIQGLTSVYIKSIINEEWPCMAKGMENPQTHEKFQDLNRAILKYQPVTFRDRSIYDILLRELDEINDARHIRLLSMKSNVPEVIWYILLLCGIFTISFSYFFSARLPHVHYLMTGVLGSSIALIFFLGLALDYPFTGSIRISPEPFEILIGKYLPQF